MDLKTIGGRKMNKLLFVMAFAFTSIVFGQQPAGDMSSKAARKLSQDEVRELLSGASTSGRNSSGNQYTMEYKSDGSLSGTVYTQGAGSMASRGQSSGMAGNWRITNEGRVCREYKIISSSSKDYKSCPFVLRLEDGRLMYSGSGEVTGEASLFEVKK
jgi:hypothetical protein